MSKRILFLAAIGALCFVGCSNDSKNTSSGEVSSQCGNMKVESDEACDDGNTDDGDGCVADCSDIEDGYDCPSEGGVCTKKDGGEEDPKAKCGNGKVESGEACDDGNTDDEDGCKADCSGVEDGYKCPSKGGACTKLEDDDPLP